MRPEDVRLDLPSIAHANEVLLVTMSPYNVYESNVKTDKIGGIAYTCVCPQAGYEKILVKVPDLPPIITVDLLTESTLITFVSFEGKFWRDRSGNYQLSCKAEKAILVKGGNKS